MDVRDDLVPSRQPRSDGRARRFVAAVLAGLIGSGLMAGVGYTHRSGIVLGGVAGAILIGGLGYGVAVGSMSAVTLCSVLSALVFAMIGPGCDDYGGQAAMWAAFVGVVIGRLVFGPRVHGRS